MEHYFRKNKYVHSEYIRWILGRTKFKNSLSHTPLKPKEDPQPSEHTSCLRKFNFMI